MKRRILAIVLGFACVPACGDDVPNRPADAPVSGEDAAADAPPGQVDAAPIDARPPADAAPTDGASSDAPPAGTSALILHYQFDEAGTIVKDSSDRGKDGALSTADARTANGRTGGGLEMVGGSPATRFVTMPSGVLTGVDDFTIAFWVKYKSFANWARIYDFGHGPTNNPADRWMFMTMNDVDGLRADSFGGGPASENSLRSKAQFPTGIWKHIALTGSGANRELYIDGFPAGSVTGAVVAPREMESDSSVAWLGRSRFEDAVPPAMDPGLDATLDDFRIYNKVLTPADIGSLAAPQRDYFYWRFDEATGTTAVDSSSNSVMSTLINGATWTAGRLGNALDLGGGDPGVTGPHAVLAANPLAECTTELTIAMWVKQRAAVPWTRVFDFGTGSQLGGSFMFLVPTDGGGMHFAMVSPRAGIDVIADKPLAAETDNNTWHHAAVTVLGNTITLYIDGEARPQRLENQRGEPAPSDFANATNLWLGRSQFPADRYFDGSIDELRISCRAFSADEIKSLAHRAQP